MAIADLDLPWIIALFAVAALIIAVAGTRLSALADRLADATGFGEAVVGTVLLGGTTSIAGLVTSAVAAHRGMPELALSNAVGGIAAQTAFLVAADFAHRKVNLEHAGASPASLMQASLLLAMLSLLVTGVAAPELAVLGIHPASYLVVFGYVFGVRLIHGAKAEPMWHVRRTPETREDVPDWEETSKRHRWSLALRFLLLAAVVAGSGWLIAETGGALATRTELGETVVGALLTAVATSLPELVTTVAAVRRGALTLGISGIFGGNAFDTMFAAVADGFYREGSIYAAVGSSSLFVVALSSLMTAVLLMGMVRRQKHGFANVGFETMFVLVIYVVGMTYVALG